MRPLEPNTVQVPGIILSEWLPHLSGAETKVILFIVLRTIGAQRSPAPISLREFAAGTGVSKGSVILALASLEGRGLITRERRTSPTAPDFDSTLYGLCDALLSRDASTNGYVYILESDGRYKIGTTTALTTRLSAYRSGPRPIKHVAHVQCEDSRGFERTLHSKYGHRRASGEWFDLTDDELSEILGAADWCTTAPTEHRETKAPQNG